jgi:hypothetical protein
MVPTRKLRAVDRDEKPLEPRLSVDEAAATGDHRKLLVAMRERIARAVADPDCPPRDLASLTRRLQDVAKELDTLNLKARQEFADDSARPDDIWDSSAL